MPYVYPTLQDILDFHDRALEISGGGRPGVLDSGGLEATLDFMQNDLYYPTLTDKVAFLFFSVITKHCFVDGNKRVAISASFYFLLCNFHSKTNWLFSSLTPPKKEDSLALLRDKSEAFFQKLEVVAKGTACGFLDKEQIGKIFDKIMSGEDEFDERFKLLLLEIDEKVELQIREANNY